MDEDEDNKLMIGSLPYSSGGKFQVTFRDVVIRHILRLSTLASVEFRGGYWQQKTKVAKDGMAYTERIYIPDSREQYGNAILFLHDILIPHFDDEMETRSDDLAKELDELRIKCIDATSIDETKFLNLKKEDSAILPIDSYQGNDKLVIEAYRFAKLRKIRVLFQEICKFLNRWNYGTPRAIIDQ